jgi:hypothetical protein
VGSSTQTAKLALPQFGDNDKPTWRGDINGAFAAIDAAFVTNDTRNNTQDNEITALTADVGNKFTGLVNAKSTAAKGDGVTDDGAAFAGVAAHSMIVVSAGVYNIATSQTIVADMMVLPGATFLIETGATLTIKGHIYAPSRDVFIDNGGTVDLSLSDNEYNLAWFKSGNGYINHRWDFARRAMATFVRKHVRIPHPTADLAGVIMISPNRPSWGFDGPMTFDHTTNTVTVYVDAEFKAAGPCAGLILITDATVKPDNLYFYGDVQVQVDAGVNVAYGVNIQACARVTFWGNVVVNGAQTSIIIGSKTQPFPVGSVRFFAVQASFYTVNAVSIYGNSQTTQDVTIDTISATAAQVAGTDAVMMGGLLRDIKIGDVYYATDVARSGYVANDAANAVHIQSTADGDIMQIEVANIYQSTATQGLLSDTDPVTPQGLSSVQYVTVERIFGKYGASAATLSHCYGVQVNDVRNNSTVFIDATAADCRVVAGAGLKNVTNNSTSSVVNSLGQSAQGAGNPPAPAVAWPLGVLIREPGDNKIYVRVANNGVAADFVVLN